MALRTRQQHLENALSKPVCQTKGLRTRHALGNIQNRIPITRNEPLIRKPILVKAKVTTKASAVAKENLPQNAKPLPVQKPKPEEVSADLSASFMDISIAEPEGFSSSILPEGVSDIDSQDAGNQFLCSDLVIDIYKYLRQLEAKWSIRPNFLTSQKDVTPRMRGILVDWLNQVHTRFGLLQETFFLTVATIDRFLQECVISRKHLQLVGVTAMFIASKYEEMYSPPVEDFVYITDNAYSKQDIFKMECQILKKLQFSFGRPLPIHFLRRNSKAGDCDAVVHTISKYILELSMQEYELAHVPPSLLSASALRLALKVMGNVSWTPDLAFYSSYQEEDTDAIVCKLANLVLQNPNSKLQAVHKKYSDKRFMKVSTLPQLRSTTMQNFAAGSFA